MKSTLFKTAVAVTVGVSVAACSDALVPTESEAPRLEGVSVAATPPDGIPRGGLYTGSWSGTLTLSPGTWTWELEQNGRTVTGTVDPAPNLPGVLTGTATGDVLDVVITYPNGALNVGQVSLDRPPTTFSGDLVLIIPNLPVQIPFSTVMNREGGLIGGNGGPPTLSATAVGSSDVPEDLASKYNVDGTLVNAPDSD